MSAANIQLVQELYAIHGRGDFEGVVAGCTPDVEWHSGGGMGFAPFAPAFVARKGHEEVREFFRLVSEMLEFEHFTPLEFYSDQDKVFVLGHLTLTMKQSGQKTSSDWVHVFTLRDGKVTAFRELFDTEAVALASRA